MALILLRRFVFLVLGIVGLALSLAALEALLRPTGMFELLGVRYHGLLVAGLIIGVISSLVTWFIARDVATGSLGIAPCTEPSMLAAVDRLLPKFNLPRAPDVGIYDNSSENAFAVGRSRGTTMLVVSRGLLDADPSVIDVVLCHQLARIARGDVATQVLLQGLTQVFTLFPTRIYALILGTALRTTEGETPTDWTEILFVRLLEAAFTPLTSLLSRAVARQAETAGDRRAVEVLGEQVVERSLTALLPRVSLQPYREIFVQPLSFLAPVRPGWAFFGFHKSLQTRIAACVALRS